MTNLQVIEKFLNKEKGATPKRKIDGGIYVYEGRTLTSDGETLTNYKTIMAKHKDGKIFVNISKYSSTTTRIQNLICLTASVDFGFEVVKVSEKEIYNI